MRIGIVSSGGDAPGTNYVLYLLKEKLSKEHELIFFKQGFTGVVKNETIKNISFLEDLSILPGTVLGSQRKPKNMDDIQIAKSVEDGKKTLNSLNIDFLVVIGGEGSLSYAYMYSDEFPIVGIPKTIDNDVCYTDETLGFNSAVEKGVELVKNVKYSIKAHRRIFFITSFGRNSGWLPFFIGFSSNADLTVVPEKEISLEVLEEIVEKKYKEKKYFVGVFSESSKIKGFSYKGDVSEALKKHFSSYYEEVRADGLKYFLRGTNTNYRDMFLANLFSEKAKELIDEKKENMLVVIRNNEIQEERLKKIVGKQDKLPKKYIKLLDY